MTLDKVKEALESIIERENERIEPLVAAGKFPVEQSVRVIAKEALTELNTFIESNGWQDIKYPIPSTAWYIEDGEPVRVVLRGWHVRNNQGIRYGTYFRDLKDDEIYPTKELAEAAINILRK